MLKYSSERCQTMQQRVSEYIFVLVIGAIIGLSIGIWMNPTPSIGEQVKVTIRGIEYTASDSVLEIELLNDVPEKNLE